MHLYDNQPAGTVARARYLRRTATEAEKHLRRALKPAFPHLKWRFQVPFGPYYADFLCFPAKLVIELDGGQHTATGTYDAARTRFIEDEGYRVLRFWNNDVLENAEGVIAAIQNSLPLWEGGAKRRKGEGDTEKGELPSNSPSPSHATTQRGPLPLPVGEER